MRLGSSGSRSRSSSSSRSSGRLGSRRGTTPRARAHPDLSPQTTEGISTNIFGPCHLKFAALENTSENTSLADKSHNGKIWIHPSTEMDFQRPRLGFHTSERPEWIIADLVHQDQLAH